MAPHMGVGRVYGNLSFNLFSPFFTALCWLLSSQEACLFFSAHDESYLCVVSFLPEHMAQSCRTYMHDRFWDYDAPFPLVKNMILWKPACLHRLWACQFWQQEAVLLSSSHVSQPCRYLRNCCGFWESVWSHNHPPVKVDQEPKKNTQAGREMHTCAQANVSRKLGCTQVCTHVMEGVLPNIMALSTLYHSIVAVCVNTSGQYNFTHHHLHTPTAPGPPLPCVRK